MISKILYIAFILETYFIGYRILITNYKKITEGCQEVYGAVRHDYLSYSRVSWVNIVEHLPDCEFQIYVNHYILNKSQEI